MNDSWLGELEKTIEASPKAKLPPSLRAAVLAGTHRELASAGWDRWLGRAAVLLLAIGIGANGAMKRGGKTMLATAARTESLSQVAADVADATDARTGRQFALRLATLAGWSLTREQASAVDSAVEPGKLRAVSKGKDG